MKLRSLILLVTVLLLQSCQQNNASSSESSSEMSARKNNVRDAASYNTQLGLAYLKQGDRPRAKRKLLTALAQAPDSPDVNAAMAWFMEQSGEMDSAQTYLKKAMATAPRNGAQLNNYGAFLCRRGKYSQADLYFQQAVHDAKYEHTAGAYENAGLCAAAIPDDTKAARYFVRALEQDPSRKQSLYELVNINVKLGLVNKALGYLQEYPALTLSDPTLLALAAQVAHKAGQGKLEADYRLQIQYRS